LNRKAAKIESQRTPGKTSGFDRLLCFALSASFASQASDYFLLSVAAVLGLQACSDFPQKI
jgi:hypothetical protein